MKILCLNGGGFNFFWYIGILNNLDKKVLEDYVYYAYSGGAIACALYLNNITTDKMIDYTNKIKKEDYNLKFILNNIRIILDDLLPEDCYKKCKNLNIIYYKLFDGLQIKNNFKNKNDLLDYLEFTSRLPLTMKNIYSIYNSFIMDPVTVNFKKYNFKNYFILKVNSFSLLTCMYLNSDKEFIKNKVNDGYIYSKNNIIIQNNCFVYKKKSFCTNFINIIKYILCLKN